MRTSGNQEIRKLLLWGSLFLSLVILTSCGALKPYERVYVNDPLMQMGNSPGRNFQNYVHAIRGGSTPAGSTKSSGGCGCN